MEIVVSFEQTDKTIAIMKITGDINASNFTEIVDKARELYDHPARDLILDLSGVPSVSTAGLAAIHNIALTYSGIPQEVHENENPDFTHSTNARKHVKLLNPQPEVEKAFEKAGMKLFFKVFHDRALAIESFI